MALKSAWAYHNGKRMMAQIINNGKEPKTGWINGQYAERNKRTFKLFIKTYANKTQCCNKIEKLKNQGIRCEMLENYPFTIKRIPDGE